MRGGGSYPQSYKEQGAYETASWLAPFSPAGPAVQDLRTRFSMAGHGRAVAIKSNLTIARCTSSATLGQRGWGGAGKRKRGAMATKKRGAKQPERLTEPSKAEPPSGHGGPGFPVVGIGASAGGLAAFEA